jgi:hypothetical protein
MPRNTTINIPVGQWVLVTDADVTAVRIQVHGAYEARFKATVGAVAPTSIDGAILLLPYGAIAADLTLAQLFPGVPGANRVYVYADMPVAVSVSHA